MKLFVVTVLLDVFKLFQGQVDALEATSIATVLNLWPKKHFVAAHQEIINQIANDLALPLNQSNGVQITQNAIIFASVRGSSLCLKRQHKESK